MTFPHPGDWLRHRDAALVVDGIEAWDGRSVRCRGAAGSWTWSRLLEGAAQAAGIACALRDPAWRGGIVVAEYRDVVLDAERHEGAVRFTAHVERPLLAYRRCAAAASAPDGRPLLRARVTLLRDERPA